MTAIALPLLLTAATLLSLGGVFSAWREHGAAIRNLRGALAACPKTVEVSWRIIEHAKPVPPAGARVIPLAPRGGFSSARPDGLRAAA